MLRTYVTRRHEVLSAGQSQPFGNDTDQGGVREAYLAHVSSIDRVYAKLSPISDLCYKTQGSVPSDNEVRL